MLVLLTYDVVRFKGILVHIIETQRTTGDGCPGRDATRRLTHVLIN